MNWSAEIDAGGGEAFTAAMYSVKRAGGWGIGLQ